MATSLRQTLSRSDVLALAERLVGDAVWCAGCRSFGDEPLREADGWDHTELRCDDCVTRCVCKAYYLPSGARMHVGCEARGTVTLAATGSKLSFTYSQMTRWDSVYEMLWWDVCEACEAHGMGVDAKADWVHVDGVEGNDWVSDTYRRGLTAVLIRACRS
jgi:hypothetical protein